MNIFVLSEDPKEAATMQCNKHVVKMIVETAQLLSAAHPRDVAPYKHTHVNHPCAVWVRQSKDNYRWLSSHGVELCAEYTRRYGRVHATEKVLLWLHANMPAQLPDIGMTPFAIAIKGNTTQDAVSAYRTYYIEAKKRFARWAPRAKSPAWWPEANV